MFFRAGWHRVGLYKLLAKMDFHVIAVDYRGNVQDFVLKLLAQTLFSDKNVTTNNANPNQTAP